MTGADVRRARAALAIDPFAFAAVLGVHVSTIYRWESARGAVRPELLQRLVLERLPELARPSRVGEAVVRALMRGGTLEALHTLLEALT